MSAIWPAQKRLDVGCISVRREITKGRARLV